MISWWRSVSVTDEKRQVQDLCLDGIPSGKGRGDLIHLCKLYCLSGCQMGEKTKM